MYSQPYLPLFPSRLVVDVEIATLAALKRAAYEMFMEHNISHLCITYEGERRMILSCAEFASEYLNGALTNS